MQMPERYQLGEMVGSGGMGQVYRLKDGELGRTVAVKTVQEGWKDEESLARFVAEARATSQLEHPNILPVYDLGRDAAGTPFYTMPLVQGRTLAAVIQGLLGGDRPLHLEYTLARRMTIAQLICEALDYAHSQGVLHRDLKPENVMVGPHGEVWLMDWGLATGTGIVGTPGYMAPEVLEGGASTVASDLYGLGTLLYELFTLKAAHPGGTLQSRVNLRAVPPADSVRQPIQGRIPKEVSNILMKLLARQPAYRFQTAREVHQALGRYMDGEAPVTCLCTGAKRATFEVGHLIDQLGTLAVVLAGFWLFLPILFVVLLATGVLHYG